MSRRIAPVVLALTLGFVTGCPADRQERERAAVAPLTTVGTSEALFKEDAAGADSPAAATSTGERVSGTFDAVCGCAVEEVGHCAELVVIDGERVALEEHDLGSMPFCGKTGVQVTLKGVRHGDAVTVESIEVVE